MTDTSDKKGEGRGLTVIIPVYNRERLVGDTLASLAAQTCRPEKVILVDNGSTDGSRRVLDDWARDMRGRGWDVSVMSEPRSGAARARETALGVVETEYVMFFDSDDWMPTGHIAYICRQLAGDTFDIVCWNLSFHHPGGKVSHRRVLPADPLRNHFIQGLLSTQAFVVRTAFIRAAGGWNPGVGGWNDYELGVRLLLQNPRIKVDTEARVDVRLHSDSITGDGFVHRAGVWEHSLDEIERAVRESSHPRRREMLRLVAYRRVILAAHYRREGRPDLASPLFGRAMESPALGKRDRLLLRLAYAQTSVGLPGAGAIYPRFLA